ncbi:MAG: hypothetical protein JWP94_754 [Mucilaginibacter sp.]|nr:hypothetical protein [Mucilaginibacter sp.]
MASGAGSSSRDPAGTGTVPGVSRCIQVYPGVPDGTPGSSDNLRLDATVLKICTSVHFNHPHINPLYHNRTLRVT